MASQQIGSRHYGYDQESYFVEKQEDGVFAAAAAERERQRLAAKQEQKIFAVRLSKITSEEYEKDHLEHMERMERETMPDVNSIDIQTEIQWFMRPYLLDFLVEAHHAFQLLPETLFLAVNLLDRYCSKRVVYKRHYQLVGCAALLIAAKFGDRKERVPTIRELKSMCCSLYDEDMFMQMEWHVLQTLGWVIGHPTVTTFIQIALNDGSYDPELEHLSWYISEIALYHKDFVSIPPSIMAQSVLALARWILGRPQVPCRWTDQGNAAVAYSLSNQLYQPSTVLRRKYASAHLSHASATIEEFMRRQVQIASMPEPASTPQPMSVSFENSPAISTPYPAATPTKGPMQHLATTGMPTPPITPDKDPRDGGMTYDAYLGMAPQPPQFQLTPPSSGAEQHRPPQYTSYFPQPHQQLGSN
ncbi:MAG: hypothetical protein M1820_005874 [Bogoriella megaspora]|nr:MAG: hypothetical protein M1820_005874 [Bogoriella megaspora]